jgi:hypothetical protein
MPSSVAPALDFEDDSTEYAGDSRPEQERCQMQARLESEPWMSMRNVMSKPKFGVRMLFKGPRKPGFEWGDRTLQIVTIVAGPWPLLAVRLDVRT